MLSPLSIWSIAPSAAISRSVAQAEFDKYQPRVVVGSSRGGAVAMNMPPITVEADQDGGKPNEESVESTHLIKAELPNWRFWKQADRQMELDFEPKSLLRWTNPGSGRVYGDLYV